MATLVTYNAAVATRVPGVDTIMSSAKRDEAVLAAVALWNRFRPQELVATIAGSATYDLTLPATYDLQTSRVISLEYPAGERRPTIVDPSEYVVYRSATSTAVLRLYAHTPAVGENVRLVYTSVHVVNSSGSTLDANDDAALCDVAAGQLCEWLSSYYSQATDGSLVVDSRDYKSQATEYALRAKRFRDIGLAHLNVDSSSSNSGGSSSVPAAGVILDRDSERMDRSIRLTHPQL